MLHNPNKLKNKWPKSMPSHSLAPLPPPSKAERWPSWPPPCKVVRVDTPAVIRKILTHPEKRAKLGFLPPEAAFPEIVAWRAQLLPGGGGSGARQVTIRGTGGSSSNAAKRVVGVGFHPQDANSKHSGRAIVYYEPKTAKVVFAPLLETPSPEVFSSSPSSHGQPVALARPIYLDKSPKTPEVEDIENSSHVVILLGSHKACIVPMHDRLRMAVLRYDKSLQSRYALRDSFGRKVFEAGANRYHLNGGGLVYCAFDPETHKWSALRSPLVYQPVTDAKRIDEWNSGNINGRKELRRELRKKLCARFLELSP